MTIVIILLVLGAIWAFVDAVRKNEIPPFVLCTLALAAFIAFVHFIWRLT